MRASEGNSSAAGTGDGPLAREVAATRSASRWSSGGGRLGAPQFSRLGAESKEDKDMVASGPLSMLWHAVKSNTQVLVSLRKKLLARVSA